MSAVLVVCGALTLALFGIHLVAGGRDCLAPMRAASFDAVARETLHVCWHAVTAVLLLGGICLLWAGVTESALADGAALLMSVLNLSFAGLFITIGSRSDVDRAWLRLGQWMAFLPIGIAGILGVSLSG